MSLKKQLYSASRRIVPHGVGLKTPMHNVFWVYFESAFGDASDYSGNLFLLCAFWCMAYGFPNNCVVQF
jgi:hypothetical protein